MGSRIAITLLAALIAAGCLEEGRECYPGDWRGCNCSDVEAGYQQCDAEGAAYGACDCSGTIPALTTSAAGTGGQGGGTHKKPFNSECAAGEECESGVCFPFNAKGPHCTVECSAETVCPPSSAGCSMMGVCKVP